MELTASCSRVASVEVFRKVCVSLPLPFTGAPSSSLGFCDVPGLPICNYQKRASTCTPGWSALGPPHLVTAPRMASWLWCWMQET